MADIFISYASEDQARVEPLAKALEDQGWGVFWDFTIPVGKTWRQVITEALDAAKCAVVIWSNTSINSEWVQEEAEEAQERQILVPAMIDKVKPPLGFRRVQAARLMKWTGESNHPEFEKLLESIEAILGPSPLKVKEAKQKRAEEERRLKQEEERKRRDEEQRKSEEERQRLEEEKQLLAEQKRKFEEEQKRIEAERKAEEERKQNEAEAKRKAVEEKRRKEKEKQKREAFKHKLPKPKLNEPTVSTPKPSKIKISEKRESIPDKREFTNRIGMKFVYIPSGRFTMGCRISSEELVHKYGFEAGLFKDERPLHSVEISKPFYLQTTETTQGQWESIMARNPSRFKDCGDECPVESVSWNDVQKFISGLNKIEGTNEYRLPTEAEWEYACRARTTTVFSFGDEEDKLDEYAWYWGNSEGQTHPVGQKKANAWGLYDMHGNVYEGCQDWYGDYQSGSVTDPKGPSEGEGRVFRGGSWSRDVWGLRSAIRDWTFPDDCSHDLGFRVAKDYTYSIA